MYRSLQFLEITTLGELTFFSPQLFTVCLSLSFYFLVFAPTLLHDVCVGQFPWGYVFFYPNKKESQESESQLKIHCLQNVSSGAGAPRAGAVCCADQYVPAGIQHKHCIPLAGSTDKIILCTYQVENNRDTYQ